MIYTTSQQYAIEEIVNWVRRPYDKNFPDFIIRGVAGTGKSTVIAEIIKQIAISSAVCAPTHKALRVVKNMGNSKTFTVHSALGLRLNTNIENFDIRRPNFDPQNKPKFLDFSVMIFDEASMIPKGLYRHIINMAIKTFTKIIFVGDPLQLPPVGQTISDALVKRDYNYIELNQIVRQEEGHPILESLKVIRDDITNNTSNYLKFIKDKPEFRYGEVGYKVYQPEQFKQKIVDVFSNPEYNMDVDYVKYLAYTNDRITSMNNFIRKNIIEDWDEAIITTNDLLTAYNSIIEGVLLNKILINSDDYIPLSVRPHISVNDFKGYHVNLKNIYTNDETSMFIIDHKSDSMIRYIQRLSELHMRALKDKRDWANYYAFKQSNVSMKKFKLYNDANPSGIIVDRDIDYCYGSTIHKSQGSTFKNVFIDLQDINKANMNGRDFRNRLIYVALSRVQTSAYLII